MSVPFPASSVLPARTRRRRGLAAAGALGALAVGLALGGCTSSGASGDTPATGSAASGGTTAPGGVLTVADFTSRLSAAQDAVSSERMVVTVKSGTSTTTSTADVARRGDAFDMAMTLETDGAVQMEVRELDGIYYFGVGDLTGGKFVRYDPADPGELGELSSTFGALADQVDPSATIDAFDGAVVSVEAHGTPDDHGVQDYVVVADTSKIGGVLGQQLAQASQGGSMTLPARLTYTFGVDAQDRIRTVRATIDSTTSTIEFSRFGEKITVAKPTADQIMSADELGS